MNLWTQKFKHWLNQAGWMGITGLSLLVFSATFYLSAIRPDYTRIAELKQESSTLRQRAQAALAHGGISATGNTASQLKTFYQFFPVAHEKNTGLAKIYSAAEHQKLTLETGEYRFISAPDNKLARYQITLPVKGSYQQMRSFVDEILAEVPFAALDDISFKRESVNSPMLDARIKLTLYFGAHE